MNFRGLYDHTAYYNLPLEDYFKFLQSNLLTESIALYNVHKNLIKDTLVLPEYAEFAKYNTERNIEVLIRLDEDEFVTKNSSLSELVLEYASASNALGNTDPNFDVDTYNNLIFLKHNGRDQMVSAIVNSANLYLQVH